MCKEMKIDGNWEEVWNTNSRIPMARWLSHSQTEQDKERLQCLGNIVVPAQASLGASLLSRIMDLP